MITHVVLFKFDDVAHAEEARDRLLALKGVVPTLADVEAGLDFTRSERSYELGLITRFADRDALEAYRVHPDHQAVVSYIREHSKGAVAVDWEA